MTEEFQSNRIRLFQEPRCYTFVTAAIIGASASLIGTGVGAASAAGAFSPSVTEPNTKKEAEQLENLEAEYLPDILGIEAAQQEGGSYTLTPDVVEALQKAGMSLSGGELSSAQQQQLSSLESQLSTLQEQLSSTPETLGNVTGAKGVQTNPAYTALESQISSIQKQIKALNNSPSTVNFSGEGTASVEGQIESQEAAGQLAEGQEYDPQFIAQELAEEQQADPQQFAARQAEYQMLENAINNPQTSPVSQTMENQIQQRVNAGSGLTPEEQAMLNAAVAGQPNEGTTGSQPDFALYPTTGFAGEQRALQNAGSGAAWLASGETPADIQYRQEQADLGDLSAYISGETPESQFSELSGAGASPTPNYQSGYLPSYQGQQAADIGASAAATQYGENVNEALTQSNPWVVGLSGVLGGANALAGAGVI